MPATLHRKVQVTLEFDTSCTRTGGELLDTVTGPLEAAARALVQDLGSGVKAAVITYASVGRPR